MSTRAHPFLMFQGGVGHEAIDFYVSLFDDGAILSLTAYGPDGPGPEGPNQWQVIGISRDQWKLLASSLVLGGNVRAGVEDNLYLPNGEMCKSNGELIAKARQMAEDIGRRPASVAEARELLGVPKRERASA